MSNYKGNDYGNSNYMNNNYYNNNDYNSHGSGSYGGNAYSNSNNNYANEPYNNSSNSNYYGSNCNNKSGNYNNNTNYDNYGSNYGNGYGNNYSNNYSNSNNYNNNYGNEYSDYNRERGNGNRNTYKNASMRDTRYNNTPYPKKIKDVDSEPKKKSSVGKIIFAVNLLVFLVSAIYLGNYFYKGQQVKNKQAGLTNALDNISSSNLKDRYASVRSNYPNLVGRLKFHNYNDVIDLPVMQTKEDPMYYLYRDQDGKDSNWGTPFLDYRSDLAKPTINWIVYAHNMKDLSQFGSLKNYKDEKYWKKYPTIEFESMYHENCEYQVFAAFYSRIYPAETTNVFKYYKFYSYEKDSEYEAYIKNVKAIDCYDTGITPKAGQQILTLSTCDYTQKVEDGRFVVMAVKK